MAVKLPLGKDIFPKVRGEGCYYVDKTEIIKKILDISFDVLLITRPRRFGKSLTLSMLEDFFDIGRDSADDFEGLRISGEKELCGKWQNKWPVISLTLKAAEGLTFESAYGMIEVLLSELCGKYAFLGESERTDKNDRELFRRLAAQEAKPQNLTRCIALLMRMMHAHYGKPAILLIDEYDVPLAKADENGYYREMLGIIRALFEPLKSNLHMKFAIVMGCLRIAKESIFTGANNFVEDGIMSDYLDGQIGFTEPEVEKLLEDAGLPGHLQEVRDWYDGYLFGSAHVYCPWDVLNHVWALQGNQDAKPKSYWLNTSGNAIVKRLLKKSGRTMRNEIGMLMEGGSIMKVVTDQITYSEIDESEANLWSVLYLTGYLTKSGETENGELLLTIPNREIRDVFASLIRAWFTDDASRNHRKELEAMCGALLKGDAEKVEENFNSLLANGISVRDTATRGRRENFYHGLLLGLMMSVDEDWLVKSNIEDGGGYSDIHAESGDGDTAFIIEVKYAEDGRLEKACGTAMEQIKKKGYLDGLKGKGFSEIYAYGIACYKKRCRVICMAVTES